MKKLAFYCFVALVFFSCVKNKNYPLIVENIDIPLISKVLIDGEIYMEYFYNEANLITEEKSKFHYSKHNYNEFNQLISSDFYWDVSMASSNSSIIEAAMNRTEWVNPENTPKSISHLLEYDKGGQALRKSYIPPAKNYTDYSEFTYEDNRIIRVTGYYNDAISGFTDYQYDTNGNITKQMQYFVSGEGTSILSATTEFVYDQMHNPYQSFRRLISPGIYTNPNNIIRETLSLNFDAGIYTERIQIKENVYEYNNQGYPVRVNELTEYVYN